MRYLVYFLVCFLTCVELYPQLTKVDFYSKIDNDIYLFSKKHAKQALNFDTVTNYVNANYQTTEAKVRAFYIWTALNIYYDMGYLEKITTARRFGMSGLDKTSQSADSVLKTRQGVCEGFSRVMNKLCSNSGIPSQMIVGYTKTSEGQVVRDILHAWNAVEIDSVWVLMDITWANGYVDYNNVYHKKFTYSYFMTDPKEFVKDHLPLDPMWQLLTEPVARKKFLDEDTSTVKRIELFSFNDSINNYLKTPEDQIEYTKYLHYHYNAPEDKEINHALDAIVNNKAVDLLNIANIEFEDFTYFFNTTLMKSRTVANCKKAIVFLESAKSYTNKALTYLKDKKSHTAEYTGILSNIKESSIKNLQVINDNISSLNKLQKALSSKK